MTLFDLPPVPESPPALEVAFWQFHELNPQVYLELHRMALELVNLGHGHLAIGMLWEVLRHRSMLGEVGADYRLNNSHRSRMARLLMDNDPRLAGVFETRALADDGHTDPPH